jgi:hypothetical protein
VPRYPLLVNAPVPVEEAIGGSTAPVQTNAGS